MHPVCQHFARLNAPCAQMPQERFLHGIHCMPCRVLQKRAAVKQNVDAVGKSVHGGGTFFHGVGTFSHGFYLTFPDFTRHFLLALSETVDSLLRAILIQ